MVSAGIRQRRERDELLTRRRQKLGGGGGFVDHQFGNGERIIDERTGVSVEFGGAETTDAMGQSQNVGYRE